MAARSDAAAPSSPRAMVTSAAASSSASASNPTCRLQAAPAARRSNGGRRAGSGAAAAASSKRRCASVGRPRRYSAWANAADRSVVAPARTSSDSAKTSAAADVVDHGVECCAPLVVRRPPVARVERRAGPGGTSAGGGRALPRGRRWPRAARRRTGGSTPGRGSGYGAAIDEQQALLGQAGQAVRDGRGVAPGEGGRRGDVEPAGEHADRAQQGAVVVVEQVVAPGDRVAQRAVAIGDAPAGGQEAQALVEPSLQPVESERRAAGRGQLDRQRHAVEGPAQHGDARGVDELRAGRRGASHEQANAIRARHAPAPRTRARTASGAGRGSWPARARRDRWRGSHRGSHAPRRAGARSCRPPAAAHRRESDAVRAASTDVPWRSGTSHASAIAAATIVGSLTCTRSTKTTPSANRPTTSAATRRTSRVLPTPPGPIAVTIR